MTQNSIMNAQVQHGITRLYKLLESDRVCGAKFYKVIKSSLMTLIRRHCFIFMMVNSLLDHHFYEKQGWLKHREHV